MLNKGVNILENYTKFGTYNQHLLIIFVDLFILYQYKCYSYIFIWYIYGFINIINTKQRFMPIIKDKIYYDENNKSKLLGKSKRAAVYVG